MKKAVEKVNKHNFNGRPLKVKEVLEGPVKWRKVKWVVDVFKSIDVIFLFVSGPWWHYRSKRNQQVPGWRSSGRPRWNGWHGPNGPWTQRAHDQHTSQPDEQPQHPQRDHLRSTGWQDWQHRLRSKCKECEMFNVVGTSVKCEMQKKCKQVKHREVT